MQAQALEPTARPRWADRWINPASLFTALAVVFAVATLNSLHVAESFLESDAVMMATGKVARAVWWLLLTVAATGIASVLWARQRR
ncbi:hypothetical protein NF556_21000 [Ornithinimicrobium faecis]|uniref:Uncharacterized protein n=1 Tax=Ornithinimicrobium faecis TaxID=2934158 RepID=A0ABY4YTU2_9MICO|nr:hypothetical protein [Ornithinimicrobium sp. HY1793]USQ80031.1 hypothetical protein NF556_21000 [Ornithinimicrobium sp. HY1793]